MGKRILNALLAFWAGAIVVAMLYLVLPEEFIPIELKYKGFGTKFESIGEIQQERKQMRRADSVADLEFIQPAALNTELYKKSLTENESVMMDFSILIRRELEQLKGKFDAEFYLGTKLSSFNPQKSVNVAELSYSEEKKEYYFNNGRGYRPKHFYNVEDGKIYWFARRGYQWFYTKESEYIEYGIKTRRNIQRFFQELEKASDAKKIAYGGIMSYGGEVCHLISLTEYDFEEPFSLFMEDSYLTTDEDLKEGKAKIYLLIGAANKNVQGVAIERGEKVLFLTLNKKYHKAKNFMKSDVEMNIHGY